MHLVSLPSHSSEKFLSPTPMFSTTSMNGPLDPLWFPAPEDVVATGSMCYHPVIIKIKYLGGGLTQANQGLVLAWRHGGVPAEIFLFHQYCCSHHCHYGCQIGHLPISVHPISHQVLGIIYHQYPSPQDLCLWYGIRDMDHFHCFRYLHNCCHCCIHSFSVSLKANTKAE